MPLVRPSIRDGQRILTVSDPAAPNGPGPYAVFAVDAEPERNTYRAFIFGLAPTGAVNDLVALGGAAGVLVRLKSVTVSGTATAATQVPISVFKRTAAYTGGTITDVTRVSSDTTDPASVVGLRHYAVAGATAGAGSRFDGGRLNMAPAGAGAVDRLEFHYTCCNDKAPNARGSSQFLAVSLDGTTFPAGGALDVAICWTEEPL